MIADISDIGEALIRVRQGKKLSQEAIAKLLATTQSHVSGIERGEFDSRLSTIRDYAWALDLELVVIPRDLLRTVQALVSETAAPHQPRFQPRPD